MFLLRGQQSTMTHEPFQVNFSRTGLLFCQKYITRLRGPEVQLTIVTLWKGVFGPAQPHLYQSLQRGFWALRTEIYVEVILQIYVYIYIYTYICHATSSTWPSQQAPFKTQTYKLITDSVGYRPSRWRKGWKDLIMKTFVKVAIGSIA